MFPVWLLLVWTLSVTCRDIPGPKGPHNRHRGCCPQSHSPWGPEAPGQPPPSPAASSRVSAPEGLKYKPLVPSGGQMEQRTQLLVAIACGLLWGSLPGPQEPLKPRPDPSHTHPLTLPALNATLPQSCWHGRRSLLPQEPLQNPGLLLLP